MLYSTSRGSLLQYASTFTAASDSTSSNIPADNSKPENTEGKEALALPFTPKRVDSLLRISWIMNLSQATPGGYHVATGLFKDSEVYALAATVDSNDDNSASRWTVHGYFEEVAGSTSERIYKIRYGGNDTTWLNGLSGQVFDGANISWLRVEEIIV